MVKLEFSSHAKEQLKRRGISQKKVLDAIKNPGEVSQSYKNREIYRRVFKDKTLEVVIISENDNLTIITAYYLDI